MSADSATAGIVGEGADPEVARSYAEALLNAAGREGGDDVEAVLDELDSIKADVLDAHPQFAAVLTSPLVAPKDKDAILEKAFDGKALPTVVRFLRVLNRHGRLESFVPITRTARALWDRRQNRRPVTVRSAVPLDEGQVSRLRDRLSKMLGATPNLQLVVDPSLIAGLVVQVGDDVYDASARNRLEQLRQRLIEGKTHEIQSRRDRFSHNG
ncbi:ATP synthase F1 subunit delta [Singulisphaera sp. PoT]|uniref:ATP synthase F1 subunit delta n=1 Tax=Singulisphaera sp. PoT TaxID=3411797 RepID=UPI003BF4674D